ncbi:hypothetical protein [Sphingomonas sp. PvP055]|uniref:hypothetical protein n=1 Tax=Sphingomonas sp. PvP055 TaxID=3156391 RepID=UPI003399C33B
MIEGAVFLHVDYDMLNIAERARPPVRGHRQRALDQAGELRHGDARARRPKKMSPGRALHRVFALSLAVRNR